MATIRHVYFGGGDPNDLGVIAERGAHYINENDSSPWLAVEGDGETSARWVRCDRALVSGEGAPSVHAEAGVVFSDAEEHWAWIALQQHDEHTRWEAIETRGFELYGESVPARCGGRVLLDEGMSVIIPATSTIYSAAALEQHTSGGHDYWRYTATAPCIVDVSQRVSDTYVVTVTPLIRHDWV